MRRIPAGLVLGLTLAHAIATPAAAQQSPRYQGFHAGIGVASALSDISCNVCVEDSKSVISVFLRAGMSVSRRLTLAAEMLGTDNSEDGINERNLGLSAVGYFYPSGRGFFLKAGVGVVKFRADDDTDAFTSTLLAGQVGAGYELFVSRRVALGGFTNLVATGNGDLDYNGTRVTSDLNLTLIQLGVGVTLH